MSLDKLILNVESKYGKGAIMKLDASPQNIEVISFGSLALDIASGVGGVPRGRIVEIYGPESSGKTTIAIHVCVEAQKAGLNVGFVDAENAFDRTYAEALGIVEDRFLLSQPSSGEEALDIVEMLVDSGDVGIVVVDSVAALTPQAELSGEMGDSKMGLQARLMSQAMRKLTAKIKHKNVTVIFINQIREKIGVMFGNPETTTGGNALKFYASQRLEVRRGGSAIKDKEKNEIATPTKVKFKKNKVAPPGRIALFEIRYGQGIDLYAEMRDFAVECGILHKTGSWYSYEDGKLAQGKENMAEFLRSNEEFFDLIREQVVAFYFEEE